MIVCTYVELENEMLNLLFEIFYLNIKLNYFVENLKLMFNFDILIRRFKN